MYKHKRFAFIGLALLIWAAAQATATAQSVVQSYASDKVLQRGLIVRLNGKTKDGLDKVAPVPAAHSKDAVGVVVSRSDSPVTLTSGGNTTQSFVATTGRYMALASTENGAVKKGDYLSVSSIDGVSMKADNRQLYVAGKALSDFNGSGALSTTEAGKQRVKVGLVLVEINVQQNPLSISAAKVPEALRNAAGLVTDRAVSPLKIYLALGILLATVAVSGGVLYASIKNGMSAIGRNPLARRTITRSVLQAVFIGLTIFIIGILGVYLLLTL